MQKDKLLLPNRLTIENIKKVIDKLDEDLMKNKETIITISGPNNVTFQRNPKVKILTGGSGTENYRKNSEVLSSNLMPQTIQELEKEFIIKTTPIPLAILSRPLPSGLTSQPRTVPNYQTNSKVLSSNFVPKKLETSEQRFIIKTTVIPTPITKLSPPEPTSQPSEPTSQPRTVSNYQTNDEVFSSNFVPQTLETSKQRFIIKTTSLLPPIPKLSRPLSSEPTSQVSQPRIVPNYQTNSEVLPSNFVPKTLETHETSLMITTPNSLSLSSEPIAPPQTLVGLIRPFNYKLYKSLRFKANRAAQNQKIFTIYGGYATIRNSLIQRGWTEKCAPNHLRPLQILSFHVLLDNAKPGNDYEIVAISKLIQKSVVNFLWQPKMMKIPQNLFIPGPNGYRNRIYRNKYWDFATKDGLISCIENTHWNTIEDFSDINVPRFYRLADHDQRVEFLTDYRTNYCLSLLKFIVNENNDLFDGNGLLPTDIIFFAISRIKLYIMIRTNEDINQNLDLKSDSLDDLIDRNVWNNFFTNVNKIIQHEIKFLTKNFFETVNIINECKSLLSQVSLHWPKLECTGYNNLWILKPGYLCRGNGIVIKRSFDDIIRFANNKVQMHYIVQKYIERPLLIYKTKFDIRQYMMLTITKEFILNIWMYKDCYLRFSSQEYQLSELDESVHITNNSVQKKYTNGFRSEKLPLQNMWSLHEFQDYLNLNNMINIWDEKIYPGMKKNIISVVLASLDETEIVSNSFELYGCDFMIDEEYDTILIEINSTPDMSNSTEVTGQICPATLEDVIKVVLDLPTNKDADIGKFELIHSVNCENPPEMKSLVGMEISGKKIRLPLCLPKLWGKSDKPKKRNKKRNDDTNKNKKVRQTIIKKKMESCRNIQESCPNIQESAKPILGKSLLINTPRNISKSLQTFSEFNDNFKNSDITSLTTEYFHIQNSFHPGKQLFSFNKSEKDKILLKTNKPSLLIQDENILEDYLNSMCCKVKNKNM